MSETTLDQLSAGSPENHKVFATLMEESRKKLLDLTLRNRLLNFSPANPNHQDDSRAHKYLIVNGNLKNVWGRLVDEEKQLRISRYTPSEIQDRIKKLGEAAKRTTDEAEAEQIKTLRRELEAELKEGEELAAEGHVWVEKISDEVYQKRLRRLKDEAETLEDATGDSAFFLACGFLKWREKAKSVEASEEANTFKFAPLVLVKISLTDEGRGTPGRRKFRIVHEDRPQDNESLKAKLRDEWEFNLPNLGENTHLTTYLAAVKASITRARLDGFEVHDTIALGFFNFARYRLWLDLDPREWKTKSPDQHPIVRSILGVTPLDTSLPPIVDATRDDKLADEVALHQEAEDIPIVRDADTSQYSALLCARKGKSIVVMGPPGSGKSQTITNLIATSLANGKRILFVAQKLPALDVVASRIRDAGLDEFSLHFYSATRERVNERKPVSPIEIHQQLTAARHLLGTKPRQATHERRAPVLAKRLNAYAKIVHGVHPVYGESLQWILCTALKLKEDAIAAWGGFWDEALLAVTLPAGAIAAEWMENRSRLLSEIARLQHEAGDFWRGWRPQTLTALDLPKVERAYEAYRQSLKELADWTTPIGSGLLNWTPTEFQAVRKQAARMTVPAPCADDYLRTISAKPEMLRLAHELERELCIVDDELEASKPLLTLLPEGVGATASFALAHLVEIERSTEGDATYHQAQETLVRLKELVATTDHLLGTIPNHWDGISSFVGQTQTTLPMSLLVAIAQQESGTFRRTPTSFLPQLARRLAGTAELGDLSDQAVMIADQVDEFKAAQTQVCAIFAQSLRAEKTISSELAGAMKLACALGLRRALVAETAAAEAACRRVEECAIRLLQTNASLVATIVGPNGIENTSVDALARAAEVLSESDLVLPEHGDARLVRAWADHVISESDARAAAVANERAAELSRQIAALIGEADQTTAVAETLESAYAAADSMGASEWTLADVLTLRPKCAQLGVVSDRLLGWAKNYSDDNAEPTFNTLREAIRLVGMVYPAPQLAGVNPATLSNQTAVSNLAAAAQAISSKRTQLVAGARAALEAAARRIGTCLQSIQTAGQQGAGAVTGVRSPVTLRDLHALGASLPTLRALPSLPVGCNIASMADEQHVASLKLLVGSSSRITASISELPSGFDYTAVPDAKAARQILDDLEETEDSPLRFFKGRWRTSKRAIKRCAPKLDWSEAVQAFRRAASIRMEEESFAADPTGQSLLGAFFRGISTSWAPFTAFSASIELLAKTLDGFERTERVVAAWRNDTGAFSAIATACARYEDAVKEGRAEIPDVFDGPEGIFLADSPITTAGEKASAILTQIEGLLRSPTLGLTTEPAGTDQKQSVAGLIRRLEALDAEIAATATAAYPIMGERFAGQPEDWQQAIRVTNWAKTLHCEPLLAANLERLFRDCLATPTTAAAMQSDAHLATTHLDFLRGKLTGACRRADDHENVQSFVTSLVAALAAVERGAELVRRKSDARVQDIRDCAALIRQLIIESSRAECLRTAISPNLPSSQAVEDSLAWAIRLDHQNLPKRLVAYCAENPAKTPEVRKLLLMSRDSISAVHDVRKSGFEFWAVGETTVAEGQKSACRIAQSLATARERLTECAAKPNLTIEEFLRGCEATIECVRFRALIPEWTATLGCDPFVAENPAEAIRETVFWVEGLQADRVPTRLLSWIVEADSDTRTQWWADVVRTSKKWRSQRTSIREAALPESVSDTALDAWRSELSSRAATLALALEQIARVVSNPAAPLARVRAAAESLARSAEAQARSELLRRQLPGSEAISTSAAAEQHRLFASALASMPLEIEPWILRVGAIDACLHLKALSETITAVTERLASLEETIRGFGPFEGAGHCGVPDEDVSIQGALSNVERATSNLHGLTSWAALLRESKRASGLGVERISAEVIRRKATPEQATTAFAAAVAWQKALVVWKENPNLERFRTTRHEDMRAQFSEADSRAIRNENRQRIVDVLRGNTSGGAASWSNEYVDQLLIHESTKKKKLVPVRKLVEKAGKRMQELCPCWLATPAAIAQFMPPGAVEFDLIIMDEASQINPEDAWGAIARGSQIVVVGDTKQMPPSSFFENAASDDDHDDEPGAGTNGETPLLRGHQQESILKAAEACLPQVWLNWHYRSLHQGLIAPANALSYARRLVLFPSSHIDHKHLGIRHRFVENGVATTGQVRNANEAGLIVDHLVDVAREFAHPQHQKLKNAPKSVGIIAMNIHQKETIDDLIELKRSNDLSFDRDLRVLESHPTEPFFVRNLENVQGDERDVIIISITYGPATPGGAPAQRFFPINQEGGERRFNVLITRAKWRMDVFSSLRPTHLTSGQLGVQHMRAFLQFCESGCLPETGVATDRCFDSPFEAHVHAVLTAKGYSVEKQVGVAGYFVDLAIKDPVTPGRYVLGIECDGATYHSSRAARDRDRLREQVLAERGWKLHRIWSTEWFYNNASVRKVLFEAVDSALTTNC